MKFLKIILLSGVILSVTSPFVYAADIEGDAWPEIDIWIGMDEDHKNRIFILKSFTEEPNFEYQEEATGISWDQRFHENWSWRAGIRYINKQVTPPDAGETRAVLDLKWIYPLDDGWLLSDRNRLDIRWFDGDYDTSYRYRNRIQLEKPFEVLEHTLTGFASYELYHDSRYSTTIQRQRFIGGVSVPLIENKLSVDLFYGYHSESAPKKETGDAVGIAIGIYFY